MRPYLQEDDPMSAGIPMWVPKGHESRQEWLAYHGMTEDMCDDLKMLVIECKVLMLQHYNSITVSRAGNWGGMQGTWNDKG